MRTPKTMLSQETKLMLEWDWEENSKNNIFPNKLANGSNKKAYWICSKCGYKWESKICNRVKLGRGCPCCSNQKVVSGKNDLATRNPELAKEWHPSKNGELLPSMVMPGSRQKVWWLCPKGHEYQASLLHRNHGTGCPICNSGRQTSFAEKAIYYYIKQIYPDAISREKSILGNRMELDVYIPSIKYAIEYDGAFWHKSKKSKNRDQVKFNLCQEKGIKLLRIKETEGGPGESDANITWFADPTGHNKNLDGLVQRVLDQFDARSNFFTRRSPYIINSPIRVDTKKDRYKILGETFQKYNWIDKHPLLRAEWHQTKNENRTPEMFSMGSSEKVYWKCSNCGKEWQATINHRIHGTGCPICKTNKGEKHYLSKKIFQFTLKGEFLREWECISHAAKELAINNANISMCAQGKRNSAGGYKWSYEREKRM